MFRSFTYTIISFLLVFSVMVPSFAILMDEKSDVFVIFDHNEEENHKKESEKKYDEKEMYFEYVVQQALPNHSKKLTAPETHLFYSSSFIFEIVLPPPEHSLS